MALASLGPIGCSGGPEPDTSVNGDDPQGGSGSSGSSDGAGGSPATRSSQAEQANGGCPTRPEKLTGTGSPGASCTTYADCKPTCCGCDDGSSYLAAACVDGQCADATEACGGSTHTSFCGSTSSSSSSSSSGGGDGRTCVAGTSSACKGSGMTWTGQQCCIDGPTTCTEGTSARCSGFGAKWTGAACCLPGAVQCVQGTSGACLGTSMTWTGQRCCVASDLLCVPDTSSNCIGAGKHWTGALCCRE